MTEQNETTTISTTALPSMKSVRQQIFKTTEITKNMTFEEFVKSISPKQRALLNRKSFKNQLKHLRREFNKRIPTTLVDPLASEE